MSVLELRKPNGMVAKLFPNPTNGMLTVELAEGADATSIDVLDASGRVVLSEIVVEGTIRKTLDLSGMAEGVYGVRLNSETQSGTSRFVIPEVIRMLNQKKSLPKIREAFFVSCS